MSEKTVNINAEVLPDAEPVKIDIGVTDYGRIVLTGSNEFAQNAIPMIQGVLGLLLEKHVQIELEKGRMIDDVMQEFTSNMEIALKSVGLAIPT